MTHFINSWILAFWHALKETSPFLLLGLLFAGTLHVLVPTRIISWALGKPGLLGAIRGSLLGMPLPLCSCSVVPTAFALRRQGASLSATTAFTISTPETSVDALAMTLALLPISFLGIRPLASFVLAITVGYAVETLSEVFSRSAKNQLRKNVLELSEAVDRHRFTQPKETEKEVCNICGLQCEQAHGWLGKLKAIFEYSYDTFFKDIAIWLVAGLVAAALIETALPADFLKTGWLGKSNALQILLAIAVGIPLYSCATATTPLVAVLLAKGLSPGAALAFLLSAPATNLGNVFVFKKELGTRSTVIYFLTLGVSCFILGTFLDLLWPTLTQWPSLTELPRNGEHGHVHRSFFFTQIELVTAIIVSVLCLKHIVPYNKILGKSNKNKEDCCHDEHDDHGHSH